MNPSLRSTETRQQWHSDLTWIGDIGPLELSAPNVPAFQMYPLLTINPSLPTSKHFFPTNYLIQASTYLSLKSLFIQLVPVWATQQKTCGDSLDSQKCLLCYFTFSSCCIRMLVITCLMRISIGDPTGNCLVMCLNFFFFLFVISSAKWFMHFRLSSFSDCPPICYSSEER